MQIHLSDISSSEGMRIQKTAEFGMDTITFQSGSFPVLSSTGEGTCRAYDYEYLR